MENGSRDPERVYITKVARHDQTLGMEPGCRGHLDPLAGARALILGFATRRTPRMPGRRTRLTRRVRHSLDLRGTPRPHRFRDGVSGQQSGSVH